MASLFGFGNSPTVEIVLEDQTGRKNAKFKDKDRMIKLPLYTGNDDIKGIVEVRLNKNKKLDHTGIRIELIGHIEMVYDKTNSSDFMSMGRELEPAGTLLQDKTYNFGFSNFEKQYESYYGNAVKLRYFLRVSINRNYAPKIIKELDFAVLAPTVEPETNKNIKMEVGIEDCLHIEFEYNKAKYHMKDAVVGKVFFLLVRIKIKMMEICIIKRETLGSGIFIESLSNIDQTKLGPNQQTENETVTKFEVMDGCPNKGDNIPIRLYLGSSDLTPTYAEVNNKFSVRYYLNLVLIDSEDRRYFKQQEIVLWRKK